MIKITKCKINNPYATIAPPQGEEDFLHDYKDCTIGDYISVLGVLTIGGGGCMPFRVGDSSVEIMVTDTEVTGLAGLAILKQSAEDFVSIMKEALPEMSAPYQAFYQHLIDDYQDNGICMPMYGRL